MDIGTDDQAGPDGSETNPVVVAALRSLATRVSASKGLAHPDDKAAAVQMFTALAVAGEPYDAAQIRDWAERSGWGAQQAQELADLGQRVLEGRPVGAGHKTMWPDNIVYIWRQDAEGDW
jgi:hypothetical protein